MRDYEGLTKAAREIALRGRDASAAWPGVDPNGTNTVRPQITCGAQRDGRTCVLAHPAGVDWPQHRDLNGNTWYYSDGEKETAIKQSIPDYLERKERTLPSNETDAQPQQPNHVASLIMLGGAIKWWWGECDDCDENGKQQYAVSGMDSNPRTRSCFTCGGRNERWGTLEHKRYVKWRNAVRLALIEAGYLTYAPHEAFKGTWTEIAQAVNDAAIRASSAFLVLSPPHALTEGTDAEEIVAAQASVPIFRYAPPSCFTTTLEDRAKLCVELMRESLAAP